jgi:hypothetical protein
VVLEWDLKQAPEITVDPGQPPLVAPRQNGLLAD